MTTERLHIVEGTAWKDAVIALLEDQSPYRPWRHGLADAQLGDPVAAVLDTDPPSMVTALGEIAAEGARDDSVVRWPVSPAGLVDLATLVAVVGFAPDSDPRDEWQLRGDAAIRLQLVLMDSDDRQDQSMRLGHSSVVAARVLLNSYGVCSGCNSRIDLTVPDARDNVHIHTVDVPPRQAPPVLIEDEGTARAELNPPWWSPRKVPSDWPGVLCRKCATRMVDDGHTSLVEFRFAQHPPCPACGARRTQQSWFGMPANAAVYRDAPPWISWRGCVITEEVWTCAECGHEWA